MEGIVSLEELAARVPGGVRLGIGGVHLARLPIALIERMTALGRRNFTFVSWGGGLALELLLEAEAVDKLVFCFSSLDIFGLAPRFREALESGRIAVEEWSALAMIQGLQAAHFRLPEMPFQLLAGSDLMRAGDFWKTTVSPFTGEPVGEARRLDVDVLLLDAQRTDRQGNIEIQVAPGVTLDQVHQQTGGKVLVADPLPMTPEPEPEQLRLLRQEIDPIGIRRLEFVPGKERLGMIESILNAEASLINDLAGPGA